MPRPTPPAAPSKQALQPTQRAMTAALDRLRIAARRTMDLGAQPADVEALKAAHAQRVEIGRLAVAFNGMLAQLDRERAVQQELTARARAAQAQQQLVEALPIALMVTAVPGQQVLHANLPAQRWIGESTEDPCAAA